MNCIRCGRTEDLEEHHIIERLNGGSDDPENKEWRCRPCHKYEHAKRRILRALKRERKRGQIERIRILERRLAILVEFNTPELIRERGTYLSYWEDETTHEPLPPYKSKEKRAQEQLILIPSRKGEDDGENQS